MSGTRDRLGLGGAPGGRLLPAMVAAMSLLAALALAGMVGASALAGRWDAGAAAMLTIQVPQPGEPAAAGTQPATPAATPAATPGAAPPTRLAAVQALLSGAPAVTGQRQLSPAELHRLLAPWLGGDADPTGTQKNVADATGTQKNVATSDDAALPLPAVLQVRLATEGALPAGVASAIAGAAPGTLIEANDIWGTRLARLATSLQACAALALLLVGLIAAGVVAAAARSSLGARRQAVEIVHGLGAAPGDIAGRFARRAALRAALGGCAGTLVALPLLIALARLAAPFAGAPQDAANLADPLRGAWASGAPALIAQALAGSLPDGLWTTLPLLPAGAAAIGWLATQVTVRAWLRRL